MKLAPVRVFSCKHPLRYVFLDGGGGVTKKITFFGGGAWETICWLKGGPMQIINDSSRNSSNPPPPPPPHFVVKTERSLTPFYCILWIDPNWNNKTSRSVQKNWRYTYLKSFANLVDPRNQEPFISRQRYFSTSIHWLLISEFKGLWTALWACLLCHYILVSHDVIMAEVICII